MSDTVLAAKPTEAPVAPKGLKAGALGLFSSTVLGVASTAPAYSLAATLGFIVAVIGLQTPFVVLVAFIPILLVAFGYKELNAVDPDCGTAFTWAGRVFGPRTGWMGGFAIVAADFLLMASVAQVAGQYVFLLFGANGIGENATSPYVLMVGIGWLAVMTYFCYRGIEISANIQKALLTVEVIMLLVMAVVALVKVGSGHAPIGHLTPSWNWVNPLHFSSFSTFMNGFLLMLFIYWGWDTSVTVNEETADAGRVPGVAAVLSTLILVGTYGVVVVAVQAFAGVGSKGIGLANPNHSGDVLSVMGSAIFGGHGFGSLLARLLVLMVLSSSAACTLTSILPAARTQLSMAVHEALPRALAKTHPKHKTPTWSTIGFGAAAIVFFVAMNYAAQGRVIADCVSACGFFIAFYYGLAGITCAWWFRKELGQSGRDLWMKGLLPGLGGLTLLFAFGYNVYIYWSSSASTTSWKLPFTPHWDLGGVMIIGVVTFAVGFLIMGVMRLTRPTFFTGRTLQVAQADSRI